jgi:hypothetical protein
MEPTETNWIGRILLLAVILFLGFHAVPVTAVAQDATTWQGLQEQKFRQQQFLNTKFDKLLALAREQHVQLERWHRTRPARHEVKSESAASRQKIRVATEYYR